MADPSDAEPNAAGIPNAHAQAVTALANFGTTAVTEGSNLARYIGRIIGTVPEDAVGLVIGDPLHAVRTLAAGWYDIKVREILERRNVKQTEPVSLSVALPLVQGAYDESREGLRDMWAALIAAAMDSARSDRVRISFIETLKRFDPMDALLLRSRNDAVGDLKPSAAQFFAASLNSSIDEIMISVDNMHRLNCMGSTISHTNFHVTPYGRGLLRACSD
jgi:hypothetical protein